MAPEARLAMAQTGVNEKCVTHIHCFAVRVKNVSTRRNVCLFMMDIDNDPHNSAPMKFSFQNESQRQ